MSTNKKKRKIETQETPSHRRVVSAFDSNEFGKLLSEKKKDRYAIKTKVRLTQNVVIKNKQQQSFIRTSEYKSGSKENENVLETLQNK